MKLNDVTEQIISSAMDVHRALGPGLLESTYEACMFAELLDRGLKAERQKELPVTYKAIRVECGYRIDLLVEDIVVVELKAVQTTSPIHEAQLLTYLKLSGYRCGLLINFNVRLLKHGIRRLLAGPAPEPL
jgi:GxxExxY protein